MQQHFLSHNPVSPVHRSVSLLAALGLAVAFGEEPDVLMAQALSPAQGEAWPQVPQRMWLGTLSAALCRVAWDSQLVSLFVTSSGRESGPESPF